MKDNVECDSRCDKSGNVTGVITVYFDNIDVDQKINDNETNFKWGVLYSDNVAKMTPLVRRVLSGRRIKKRVYKRAVRECDKYAMDSDNLIAFFEAE